MARYKCKSIAALDIALGGLPAKMQVEADVGTGVSAKTVGELRRGTSWSENLVLTIPQERHPESAVKISKASVAPRPSSNPSYGAQGTSGLSRSCNVRRGQTFLRSVAAFLADGVGEANGKLRTKENPGRANVDFHS